MNSLANIFRKEKERWKNRGITVMYSEAERTMQYRDVEGNTMTVKFDDGVQERIFFRKTGTVIDKEAKKQNRELIYGSWLATLRNKGLLADSVENLKDYVKTLPDKFPLILEDYRFNRTAIGVDDNLTEAEKEKTASILRSKALKEKRKLEEREK